MAKPKIGIALGSGGARGWCHIGALRALAEEGFEPEIVAGCSMGALVGAAYAAGKLGALEEWALSVNWRKAAAMLDISWGTGGLIDGKRITAWLKTIHEDAPIESLAMPFMAIASDLQSGREVWLHKGSVIDAVRASIAIPGVISPMKLDGRWLLDGGMTNPVPVSACRAMGAEILIAVNPNAHNLGPNARPNFGKPAATATPSQGFLDKLYDSVSDLVLQSLKTAMSSTDGPGYFDVLSSSIDIMTSQILRSRLAGEPPHVLVSPYLNHISVLEFDRAKEAIEEGYRATQQMMPLLREYLS